MNLVAGLLSSLAPTPLHQALARDLLVLPVLLPLAAAGLSLMTSSIRWRRALMLGTTLLLVALSGWLLPMADLGDVLVYRLGNWPVPVAIVLSVDRLAALLLLLTAIVATGSAWAAVGGDDQHGPHFHAAFLLLIAGVNGAFLTGDLFNLFVSFELLLIASYGLLVFGGTPARVRSGVQYVVLNLVGSSIFLVGIGILYSVTGTLNLAELSQRVALLDAPSAAFVRSGALLLLVVFALKAALVPFSFWLPAAYSAASPPVAALFAILTKVGVYAIVRMSTMVVGTDAAHSANVYGDWLWPMAVATVAFGALAAIGTRSVRRLQSALLIISVGTMLATMALGSEAGLSAGLFYLVHSTIAAAAMFLIAALSEQREAPRQWTGILFFVGALSVAGLPPLAGFLGKVLMLQAFPADRRLPVMWTLVLGSSLLAVIALSRRGAALFWGAAEASETSALPRAREQRLLPRAPLSRMPPTALLLVLAALTAGAGALSDYTQRTAQQLLAPGQLRSQILDTPGGR